jgi:uncharacterized protein YggE
MTEQPPGVIRVEVTHSEEIPADHAHLFVAVRGSSLVTGNVALQKAREVAQLVSELITNGLTEEDIRLQNVHAEQSSGFLGRSSSAIYSLKIRCPRLESLADLLGIITTQKNASLQSIQWGYPEMDEIQEIWLEKSIQSANEKARRIASALGVSLLGVHQFIDTLSDPESQPQAEVWATEGVAKAMNPTRGRADMGLEEVSHSKLVTLHVIVEYRVSDFASVEPRDPARQKRSPTSRATNPVLSGAFSTEG